MNTDYKIEFKRKIDLAVPLFLASTKHPAGISPQKAKGTKSPFLCTARIPFTFHEIIFIYYEIQEEDRRPFSRSFKNFLDLYPKAKTAVINKENFDGYL